jgi:secondary thiamine-phosphate synthase enzyme
VRQAVHRITVETRGRGFVEITGAVDRWTREQKIVAGLLTLFIQHTSASLLIQENADPDVVADLEDAFHRLAPCNPNLYRHTLEGPDDMPAHIRAALTATQVSVPVIGGRLALGTWQGIYVFEHRDRPHRRSIALHLLGE